MTYLDPYTNSRPKEGIIISWELDVNWNPIDGAAKKVVPNGIPNGLGRHYPYLVIDTISPLHCLRRPSTSPRVQSLNY